ncbi:MAG: DUF3073 domain-containing protein [Actinomycetales bacterium]|jgi:hypothetical protein|uniref:DUF3073 domain-containing protein n=1 Tax=Candidatus Phosphoribacter hodrii TaxID=2953743 RepID=A0A935CDZ9_9MICO|nr:DUF3073 domain-containing protein [Candidatus Phosphoribacter hodrii]
MGRGRAKAKQTKVARELKYFSPDTDLSALERELHSATHRGGQSFNQTDDVDDDEDDEEEDDDANDGEVDDDYASWAAGR